MINLKVERLRLNNSYVTLAIFNSSEYRLTVTMGKELENERLSQIFGRPALDEIPSARMNLGYFDPGGREHLGTFVTDGLYYFDPDWGFLDLIYDLNNQLIIKHIADLQEVAYWQGNAHFAVGTSFSLIQDGEINLENSEYFDHAPYRNPRSAIGQDEDGNIVLCVVDGRSRDSAGVTAKEFAIMMKAFGCINAVNLDGGGSSEMIVGDKIYNRPSDGQERRIGSALITYGKVDVSKAPVIRQLFFNGIYVHLLQRWLTHLGYNVGEIDGVYGGMTKSKVKAFQSSRGLAEDGVVGPFTWGVLVKEVLV